MGLPTEKRDLLQIVTSNRLVHGKCVDLTLYLPFSEVANRFQYSHSGPYRDKPRTFRPRLEHAWATVLRVLSKWCETHELPDVAFLGKSQQPVIIYKYYPCDK
jgi:hypothetical protein